MKSLKWLLEIIYYEANHKYEKSHDIFPNIVFLITTILPFIIPILDFLLGYDLAFIIVMLVITPIMCLSVYLYFRFHHNDIMNNEEYKNVKNRRKIYNTIFLIGIIGWFPLTLLCYFILKTLF